MLQNINLNLLKYFYEVVNTKNITKASQNLLISQPAITRAIKELETELNTNLLERSKMGVVPTTEGEILYNHIKEMFSDFNKTLNTIETVKNKNEELYIGVTTTNFFSLMKDTFKSFREKYPNVHINIVLEEIKILEERLKIGKLDILVKCDYEYMEGFCKCKSFEITDKFIAAKKHFPELENKKLSLKELLELPTVLLSPITHGRQNFDHFLKSQKIKFKPTYEFNSYSLCRELISQGFGIGIGNPIHYKDSNKFIILNTNFELPSRTFDIGYLTQSKNNLIKNFIELI